MKGLLTIGIDYMFREHYLAFSTLTVYDYGVFKVMTKQDSKNLSSMVSADFSDSTVKIVKRVTLPFIITSDSDRPRMDYRDVIGTFAEVIIAALTARREACLDMLTRNIDNIVHNDGHQIVFKKNNGSYHTFNVHTYEAMDDVIAFMSKGDFKSLKKMHYDQITKALYWIEKPADRNGISFGNLISCLTEMLVFTEA